MVATLRLRPELLLLPALALLLARPAAAQVPPPPPPPPPAPAGFSPGSDAPAPVGTGLLLGQVVDAGSGRPLAGALVYLTSPRSAEVMAEMIARETELISMGMLPALPSQTPPVMTDSEGRFLFRGLAKGSHTLRVTQPGYAPGGFAQSRPDGPSRAIDLDDGEKRLDVTVRLWKFGVITGTVTDESGEPAVGMSVRAFRRTWSGGRRRLTPTTTVTTDDRGRYRLANLLPGEFLVGMPSSVTSVPAAAIDTYARALATGSTAQLSRERLESGAPLPSIGGIRLGASTVSVSMTTANLLPATGDRLFVYPTVFYPNSAGLPEADAVRVGSGEERAAVDLRIAPTATVRVSGTVMGPDGPAADLGIRLVHPAAEDLPTDTGFETGITSTDAAGRFTFPGIPPGQYVLKAYRIPRPGMIMSESINMAGGMTVVSTMSMAGPPTAGPTYFAQMPIAVGDSDLDDVTLALRTGSRVSGRIEFQGNATRPTPARLSQLSVSLTAIGSRLSPAPAPARSDAEGRFTTAGYPPGRYSMTAATPGPDWVLESITVGGVNVLDTPFELSDTDIAGAVVTFTDRLTELSGTVQASGPTGEGITVIVFPADVQAWMSNGMPPRRTVSGLTGSKGEYHLRIPLAGDYLVAAVPPDLAADNSPEFFAALERLATRVSFATGDKKTQPLTIRGTR